jgi:hypothetical protein
VTLEVVGTGGTLYGWLAVPRSAIESGAVRPGGTVRFARTQPMRLMLDLPVTPWCTVGADIVDLAMQLWGNDGAQPRLVFAAVDLPVSVLASLPGFTPAPDGCWL